MNEILENSKSKEKALLFGFEYLSDIELLAFFLDHGMNERKSIAIATELFKTFDNWRRLSFPSWKELQSIKGLDESQVLKLKACFEIARRFNSLKLNLGDELRNSKMVFKAYHARLRDFKKEYFFTLLLDSKHRIIKEELVSIGSINISIVHPREVFVSAIRETAESLILLHNHPSGDPTPSTEDYTVTARLVEVSQIVGISILDHIIIGDNDYFSFSEQHALNNSNAYVS